MALRYGGGSKAQDPPYTERGFTLIEMLMVTTVVAIMAGMAVPLFNDMSDSIKLGEGGRQVERVLQTARMTAVSSNQPIRVRFNCPNATEYRMVELIGTPAVPNAADSATNRCTQSLYPFPAADSNPLTRPNNDGPIRYLPSDTTFQTANTIEFWPDGSAHMASGTTNPWPVIATTGTSIVLLRKGKTKTITVNGIGKITLVP
jgi:prepilin-type N-terminal cleavage/methylation domain-containing protein